MGNFNEGKQFQMQLLQQSRRQYLLPPLAVTNLWELESETRHMQRAKATVRVRWGGY